MKNKRRVPHEPVNLTSHGGPCGPRSLRAAAALAALASLGVAAISSNAAVAAPAIYVNGGPTSVTAIVRHNQVFVPVRRVFEKLNAAVVYRRPVPSSRGRPMPTLRSFNKQRELIMERHAVTGDGNVDSESLADETIRTPLTEEHVNISKETVVREDVEIGKRRVGR
jgi:hypothetical protein